MSRAGARVADLLLAASVASWGVRRALATHGRPGPVDVAVVAIDAVVAVLFVVRVPPVEAPRGGALARALPSMLAGVVALRLASAVERWPASALALVLGGVALSALALASLGRSFAVLPVARPVVRRGPYALVRHPAYLGELMVVAGCALAARSLVALGVLTFALPAFALRALAEERRLLEADAYAAYAREVRFRLVPLLW